MTQEWRLQGAEEDARAGEHREVTDVATLGKGHISVVRMKRLHHYAFKGQINLFSVMEENSPLNKRMSRW